MLLLWSVLVTPLLALPAEQLDPIDDFLRTRSPSFEWTAWGDSYASGVGAGTYVDGRRCLRYDQTYPVLINNDADGYLPGSGGKFNNVVCSGATAEDVTKYQFYDTDQKNGKPTAQYYPRPAVGNPTMGTLTVGGDDIDFPGILNNCIVEGFPWPLSKGFKTRTCDAQRALSWKMIAQDDTHSTPSEALVAKIDTLIKKIVTLGKTNTDKFKLYVTGYGQFFNEDDPYCDGITFARKANGPGKDNTEPGHVRMTRDLRKDFNMMSKTLNAAIKKAVDQNSDSTRFIDIDAYLPGSRFCEPDVKEPDPNNKDAAFFHYPYGIKEEDPAIDYLNQVAEASASSLSWDPEQTLWRDYLDEFWSQVDESALDNALESYALEANAPDPDKWFWSTKIGPRVKIFHPQPRFHQIIYKAIINQYLDDEKADTGGNGNSTGGQQIAMASYTNPSATAAWQQLIGYDSSKLSVLVANVLNGPDYIADTAWNSVITQAAGSGKTVIGYVRTGYLGVSTQKFKTRLGSGDLADWASQIEQDVDKWFELYPSIGGIFFDEGWPQCGPDNIYSDLYAHINVYTKRKHPGAFTVLNPGSQIEQCYEDTMDTLLTFESDYGNYTAAYNESSWTPKDDRKIWHIVYGVTQDQIATVAALSRQRHVGLLEMTDDVNPNPYDVVPSDAYMQAAMSSVSGGQILKNGASALSGSYVAGVPSDVNVIASDYTSATITWSKVANALGYAVYQNGALVLELPASLTRATIGMLKPGTSGISFEVKTILSSGGGGGSITISASTKSLPSNGSITDVSYKKNGDTVVYTANVLVPYAFVRLFIGGPHKSVGASVGWPIDAGLNNDTGGAGPIGQWKLVNYMVEGNDFYSGFFKYTGSYLEGQAANADWTFTPQGTAPQTQSGYTYTWNVPLGGTDALPEDYVVQGQGYAPLQNVFGGSLRSYKCAGTPCDDNPDYDCHGSTLCTTPDLLSWCDHAANNLTRTATYTSGGGLISGAGNGACWGDGVRGCGVFVQGSGCAMSGSDMWDDYQNLRKLGGCSKCGSYHRNDGCLLTVNYVSQCDIGLPEPETPPGN